MVDLKGRSFLTLRDFSREEIRYLLDLSKKLKEEKHNGKEKRDCREKILLLYLKKIL